MGYEFFTVILWVGIFLISIVVLDECAEKLVDLMKSLGHIVGWSAFTVGIVFGSPDIEETVASVFSAVNKMGTVAVGNVIGNTIIAITLGFGLPALFREIHFDNPGRYRYFLAGLFPIIYIVTLPTVHPAVVIIGGISAIVLYLGYMIYAIGGRRLGNDISEEGSDKNVNSAEENDATRYGLKRTVLYIIILISIIGIFGELLADSIETLMEITGLGQNIFGYVIVALATNAEELFIITASIKKQSVEVGTGVMFGKLIWNLGLTYGLSVIIYPDVSTDILFYMNSIMLIALIPYFAKKISDGYMNSPDGFFLLTYFAIFLTINIIL